MPRAAHRQAPNRAREQRERVWARVAARLSGVICGRCGATFANISDKCLADLNESCPGFREIDAACAREMASA